MTESPSLPAAVPSVVSTPEPTPAITGLTGRVVFARAGGGFGNETVFIANIDGSNEQQLGPKDALTCCPFVNRDGTLLAINGAGPDGRFAPLIFDLHDLTKQTQLHAPPGTLNFGAGPISPDGRWIASEGFDDAHPGLHAIYLIRTADGGGLKRITPSAFIAGDWSPDGKRLVLFKGADGDPPPPGSLWLVNPDGSGLHQLTRPEVLVNCCFNYHFSSDGSKVLFATEDGVLWTIETDGSGLTQVFKAADGRFAITPSWSPDASMIIFGLGTASNPFSHPPNELYVIRADGSGMTQVIGGADFKREPIWLAH